MTLLALPPAARAQPVPATAPSPPAGGTLLLDGALGKLTVGGYAEIYYSYNFNNPSNGYTNYRGFDNRHNTFTLDNVALDTQYQKWGLSARLTLQIGEVANTAYLSEPVIPATTGAGGSDGNTWKYLQQAYIGYRIPLGKGLLMQAGVFVSPVGFESLVVKDNWHWSRSNLFFGLPFYHTGIRGTQQLTEHTSVTLAVYNGWNGVVDNNAWKSLSAQLSYSDPERLNWSILYFGGNERPTGAPEGEPWRNLLDAWVQFRPISRLWIGLQGSAGFEVDDFGTSYWAAGLLDLQLRVLDWLYFSARGDFFREQVAQNEAGRSTPIAWPVDWVSSATVTTDFRVRDLLLLRLEYRFDEAQAPLFYRGAVASPIGSSGGIQSPNATTQNTLTLGATAWF